MERDVQCTGSYQQLLGLLICVLDCLCVPSRSLPVWFCTTATESASTHQDMGVQAHLAHKEKYAKDPGEIFRLTNTIVGPSCSESLRRRTRKPRPQSLGQPSWTSRPSLMQWILQLTQLSIFSGYWIVKTHIALTSPRSSRVACDCKGQQRPWT